MDGEVRMVALVGEERGDASSFIRGIIVGKLCKWEELSPIILLIITINAQVLLQRLVHSLSLSTPFGVIAGSEVEADVEGSAERMEEVRNELQTPVGGDMRRNSMFRKHMEEEQFG
jgi:hypothetical protein